MQRILFLRSIVLDFVKFNLFALMLVCIRVWMGGVSNSLISKNLAHYSLSLNFLLIL